MTPIECALQAGNLQLAHELLTHEWDRIGNPAKFYYQVIRDGLVATFQHLESARLCPEWDSFRHCSNAVLELDVKNVRISEEMDLLVMYKLSRYGLRNLCGDPVSTQPGNCWRASIDRVVQWVRELRSRPRWYDFLDVDDQVMFRIRMIHNHLFFVKDKPAMRELPLKEMIFCLAIFVGIHDGIQGNEVYKVVINKRNVMQFLLAIVSRLKAINNVAERVKYRKSNVLKKLHKTYRRVKQMYSVFKIIQCAQIYKDIDDEDYRRCNASVTVATLKRFNQICGEAIKNTADTPNLSKKLNQLLPEVLTDSIMLNSQYRNFSSHGIPLSHLFVRDCDRVQYYKKLNDFIYITAIAFLAISIFLLHDCTCYMYGLLRRCHSIDDRRAFIRYAGGNTIRPLQDAMFKRIEQYLACVENRLNEVNAEDLSFNEKCEFEDLWDNYNGKVKIIQQLRDAHRNNFMDTVEVLAFTNMSITAMNRLLDSKLTVTSSDSFFDTMFTGWNILIMESFDSVEFNAVVMQSYIHQYLELDHDSTEQWRYRDRTTQIFNHFTSDSDIDPLTSITLEDNLHRALSKSRNGYYKNIFALDSKAQAITQTLKASIIGPKASKEFKSKNINFKTKLEALRHQDEQELNRVFHQIIQNLQGIFRRNDCETIVKLSANHGKIPLKERLAIEYWQLQAMEMLYSSGYLGDNYSLLTRPIPMIWGKSYRNYLAHDSLSYDLLTISGTNKVLVNGFVLAFDSSDLNIFTPSPTFNLDGLVIQETESVRWLELQASLLESLKSCDVSKFKACLNQSAELGGCYLISLGNLLRPMYSALPGILSHEQLDHKQIKTVNSLLRTKFHNIRDFLTNSKINSAVKLNLLQVDSLSDIQESIEQFELLQPRLVTPCIGTVLPRLINENNFELLETLIDRYAGSNLKTILLMSTGQSETERDFLQTHLDLRLSIIGELTDHDLNELFTEEYPASYYELDIAIIRNDQRLFKHLVHNRSELTKSVLDESDLLQAMESCCCHGRLEMARCLLDSGLQCELFAMSRYLTLAISRHHWKIVDLLLQNGAYEWLDDGVNVFSIITEGNFKLLRRILREPVPDHLQEKFVDCVVRLGSKRLLAYVERVGVNLWKYNNVLTAAAMNEDSEVLKRMESRLLQPVQICSNHTGLRFWIRILQDLKMLMLISIDTDFMASIMTNSVVAERWVDRIADLLMINDGHCIDTFHFEDLSELYCIVLPDNCFRVFEYQFHQTIGKCDIFSYLVQSVPQGLFVSEFSVSIVLLAPNETIIAEVDVTLYAAVDSLVTSEDRTAIVTQHADHTADIISMGLRSYLLKFRHLKAVTASISIINNQNSPRFYFLQIDASSCIVQQSPRCQFKLSYLLNQPNQPSILHYVQPNASPRTVETLLRLGANPSFPDDKHRTPIRTVLARPFPVELIRLMYQYCDKPHFSGTHVFNLKDLDGFTPLHAAVGTNNYDVVKFLLENGADPALADQTGEAATLCYAILNRNVRVVELLIRHSPRLVRQFSCREKRTTALESAVKINHDHLVRLLLESGANLNHRNREQCTALKYAIELEAVESLQVMLEFAVKQRLDLDDDINGLRRTALQFAIEDGACLEILQVLVCYNIQRGFMDLRDLSNKFDHR